MKVQAVNGPVTGLVVKDLEIDSPTFAGVQIEGPFALSGATFSNIGISGPGTSGIYLANASGGATFSCPKLFHHKGTKDTQRFVSFESWW